MREKSISLLALLAALALGFASMPARADALSQKFIAAFSQRLAAQERAASVPRMESFAFADDVTVETAATGLEGEGLEVPEASDTADAGLIVPVPETEAADATVK